MVNSVEDKPIETSIRRKLEDALKPLHMEVFNESYMHNVPKGSETHFKVLVVSDKFNDQSLIKVIIWQLLHLDFHLYFWAFEL